MGLPNASVLWQNSPNIVAPLANVNLFRFRLREILGLGPSC